MSQAFTIDLDRTAVLKAAERDASLASILQGSKDLNAAIQDIGELRGRTILEAAASIDAATAAHQGSSEHGISRGMKLRPLVTIPAAALPLLIPRYGPQAGWNRQVLDRIMQEYPQFKVKHAASKAVFVSAPPLASA